jgi:hypothetical protein
MKNLYTSYFTEIMDVFDDLMEDHLEKTIFLKEKALNEYKEALKMPRKKKKKAKKNALLLYSIACWGGDLKL